MKKLLLVLSVLFWINSIGFAQNQVKLVSIIDNDTTPLVYKWMGSDSRLLTEEMKLVYKKPKKFVEVGTTECFKDYPKLESTFTCIGNQLHSKDGQCISFLVFPPIHTKEFQERLKWLFPNQSEDLVDKQHSWQMRGIIKRYYGEIGSSWTDSIKHYPADEAVTKFNADSAFYFSLNLNPEDYYKGVYKYVKVLVLQKKDRGYAYICSFYTDKAKKQLNKYWCRIEKTLRYED